MTGYAEVPPLTTVENEPTVRGIKIAIIRALLSLIFIFITRFSYLLKLYEKRAVNMSGEMSVVFFISNSVVGQLHLSCFVFVQVYLIQMHLPCLYFLSVYSEQSCLFSKPFSFFSSL